jgi:hypothetical protein
MLPSFIRADPVVYTVSVFMVRTGEGGTISLGGHGENGGSVFNVNKYVYILVCNDAKGYHRPPSPLVMINVKQCMVNGKKGKAISVTGREGP